MEVRVCKSGAFSGTTGEVGVDSKGTRPGVDWTLRFEGGRRSKV